MSSNPYQVCGPTVPPLLGRRRLLSRLTDSLDKPSPDHLSVVGPSFIGKSVLLHHLATSYASGCGRYIGAIYWDLRHHSPVTDGQFLQRLAAEVRSGLVAAQHELAQWLDLQGGELYEQLQLLADELGSRGERLLLVLDGMDRILDCAEISRDLWDNLRQLGQASSVRFVVGSRLPLSELCKSEACSTSDFDGIFNQSPLFVERFCSDDLPDLMAPLAARGTTVAPSASEALLSWTGGLPVLTVALLQRLWQEPEKGELTREAVGRVAEKVAEESETLLGRLWSDLSVDQQAFLADLAGERPQFAALPRRQQSDLQRLGLVDRKGEIHQWTCRMLEQYVRGQSEDIENIRSLFADEQSFFHNIRAILELRLGQVPIVEQRLRQRVEKAIRALDGDGCDAIDEMRKIADDALDAIWRHELPTDRVLPPQWLDLDEIRRITTRALPGGRGHQCRVLELITSTEYGLPLAQAATRRTYYLVQHVKSLGDYGQHLDGDEVPLCFAASACHSAIELCASIASDILSRQ